MFLKNKFLLVIFFVGICLLFFSYEFLKEKNKSNTTFCNIQEKTFKIKGSSMLPLISNGSDVNLLLNYYNCNPFSKGDTVIFKNPYTGEQIIKNILILPGDLVKIDSKKGYVYINNTLLKNSVGEVYFFDKRGIDLLRIYIDGDGYFTRNTYFLLGDNIYNSIDSREFGPIGKEGILGKVKF